MNGRRRLLPLLLLFALLTGCAAVPQEPAEGMTVYYLEQTVDGQCWAPRMAVAERALSEQNVCALIGLLQSPPEGLIAALPPEVRLQTVQVSGNLISLDFSGEYAALSESARSVACAAVTETLLAQEGAFYLSITADGEPQSPLYVRYYTQGSFVLE